MNMETAQQEQGSGFSYIKDYRWMDRLALMVVVTQIALSVFAMLMNRHLYSDGAIYFVQKIANPLVDDWNWPRRFAFLITQSPLVIAIRYFHWHDVFGLSQLYGFALFMGWNLSLIVPYLLLRRTRYIAFFIFPLVSYLYVSLNGSLFIISESHLATAAFWILFTGLFCIHSGDGRVSTKICLLVSAVASLRLYETFLFFGLFLAAYCVWVLIFRPAPRTKPVRGVLLMVLFLILLAAILAGYYVIHPVNPATRSGFLISICILMRHATFVISTCAVALFVLSLFVRFCSCALFSALALMAGLGCGLATIFITGFSIPSTHYPARIANLYMPLIMSGLMLVCRNVRVVHWRHAVAPILALFLWNSMAQLSLTLEWRAYCQEVLDMLGTHRGITYAEDNKNWKRGDYLHTPSLPSLSIALTLMKTNRISCIIDSKKPEWRMFDPTEKACLPDVNRYGASYELGEDSVCDAGGG